MVRILESAWTHVLIPISAEKRLLFIVFDDIIVASASVSSWSDCGIRFGAIESVLGGFGLLSLLALLRRLPLSFLRGTAGGIFSFRDAQGLG